MFSIKQLASLDFSETFKSDKREEIKDLRYSFPSKEKTTKNKCATEYLSSIKWNSEKKVKNQKMNMIATILVYGVPVCTHDHLAEYLDTP